MTARAARALGARISPTAMLVLAIGAGACSASGDTPGMIVLPGMFESVPVDPYRRDPLGSELSLRKPPEGTIPVGFSPFPYGPGPEEAARAARYVENPLEPTAANLERGAAVYATFCQVCHGSKGEGDGPIIGRFPNPPNLKGEHTKTMKDGQIFHVLSRGQGIMPSYAPQIRPDDRWRVVLWLRQLQQGGAQ